MKIVRPGNTEIHLIFLQFCEKYCNLNPNDLDIIKTIKITYIDWLYKTSGYYDKSILQKPKYNFPEDYTDNVKEYINKMTDALTNSDEVCGLIFLNKSILSKYIPEFEKKYNTKCVNQMYTAKSVLPFLINKKVLIISPFKEQIEKQILNGNLLKINPKLNNTHFITYKFPYTFLNNGPHQNSLETLEYIQNDIQTNYTDFDIAILSCGSYGTFLVDTISTVMKKDAIYIGGELPLIFGICGQRYLNDIDEYFKDIDKNLLIIGIPDEFKPNGWEKIENGCYW